MVYPHILIVGYMVVMMNEDNPWQMKIGDDIEDLTKWL